MARIYRFMDYQLDLNRLELRRQGESVPLPKLSYRALQVLVEAAPEVVGFDELMTRVWGPDRVITPENLSQRIRILRRSLGDSAKKPTFIEVVRGRGVRFIATVHSAAQGTSGSWLESEALWDLQDACSLAVPAFQESRVDPQSSNVSRSLHSEILNALAQHDRLKVSAQDQLQDVNYALEGLVRVTGSNFKLSLKLARVSDGIYLWSETFEAPMEDLVSSESTIATNVNINVRSKMLVDVMEQNSELWPAAFAGIKSEAVLLYIKALQTRYTNVLHGPFGAKPAMGLLERAIEVDNSFSAAHGVLASTARQRHYAGVMALADAKQCIERSLRGLEALGQSVNPFMAGQIHTSIDLDYQKAEDSLTLAIEKIPDTTAWAYYFLASIAAAEGMTTRANRLLERAGRHRPRLDSEQAEFDVCVGFLHTICGNYDLADGFFEKSLNTQISTRGRQVPLRFKAMNCVARGDGADIAPILEELWSQTGHTHPELLAFLIARRGEKERAKRLLLEAPQSRGARLHLILGWMAVDEEERAIEMIREAIREQDQIVVISLRLAAFWNPLRQHSAFNSLLDELDEITVHTREYIATSR